MYSPYLYARQSELLALRQLLKNDVDIERLLPVVEPALINPANIIRCMEAFGKRDEKLAVIINPKKHEFNNNSAAESRFRAETSAIFQSHQSLIPTYMVHEGSSIQKFQSFLHAYRGRTLAVVHNCSPMSNADFASLLQSQPVAYHLIKTESTDSSQTILVPPHKAIRVTDNFSKQRRNADYGAPELYTTEHNLIGSTLLGIGDYTVTGKGLEVGGGAPGAVAIHATILNSKNEIWMEHFVSDQVERDEGFPSTKFLEAARKLVHEVQLRPQEFGNDHALLQYQKHVNQNSFPGLPKNKEYQIYHHICRMLSAI